MGGADGWRAAKSKEVSNDVLTPLDQYALAGAAAVVALVFLYWPDGLASLIVGLLLSAGVTSVGYIRVRKATVSDESPTPVQPGFSRASLIPVVGFVAFYGAVVLFGAALGEALDRGLPDDDPVELGALVGGGLAGALIGISAGARAVRRRI